MTRGGFMKRNFRIVGVLISIFLCPWSLWAVEEMPVIPTDEYIIGPGDILDISVWKDEALTKLVTADKLKRVVRRWPSSEKFSRENSPDLYLTLALV
jgi:protein involved in polysaccharide export with SLBB domain